VIRKLAKILNFNGKSLLRLAHIDKIPEDIKQELQNSAIITPKEIVDTREGELRQILENTKKHKKKDRTSLPAGCVPIINDHEGKLPRGFEEFEMLWEAANEFIQFSLAGISAAFAIRMPDVSMAQKEGISFPQGSLIFFSAAARLHAGDCIFVVYRSEDGWETLFRYLKGYNRTKIHLVSLNNRYRKEIILPRRLIHSIWNAVAHLELIE
jgi:hypothetical protein